MAWRNASYLGKTEEDKLRAKIKAGDIINRFQRFVLGDEEITLSREQVRAGTVLLHKVLPDLAPVEAATGATPVKIEIVRFGSNNRVEVAKEPLLIDATPAAEGEKVN